MSNQVIPSFVACLLAIAGCGAATKREAAEKASAPALADEAALTCEGVLVKAKDAAGGDAWDAVSTIHQEGSLETGGMSGTFSSLEDLRTGRFSLAYTLGPLSGEQGFDGAAVWSKDQSGSVNVSESKEAVELAANEAFRAARAFWYPERRRAEVRCQGTQRDGARSFRVVEFRPKGGSPFEMWIDEKSWLLDRIVEPGAERTETRFLSDYRQVSGIMLPHALRSNDGGEAKYDQFFLTERVDINAEADANAFQVPQEDMGDFTIAGGKDAVEIPFELVNNHIFIQARVNGQGPLPLLVDTGGSNILTPTAAKELGVKSEGSLECTGAGDGSLDTGLAKVSTLTIGDAELTGQIFSVIPLEFFEQVDGIREDGLVGHEVFKRFVVTIDYADRKLVLRRPEAFEPDAEAVAVPFVFASGFPLVEGQIDGVAGTFGIDTGDRWSLRLSGPFAEANALAEKYQPKVEALTGWGVGGGTRGRVFRAGELVLGDVHIDGPVTELSLGEKGADSDKYISGNVGGGVLKRFTVTFDYGKKLIYFKKNRDYEKRGNWDRSGLWMNLEGDVFVVKDVVLDSPADRAGIKVGDTIIAIDGKKVKNLSLSETREKFRNSKPGTKVRLELKTETGARRVTIELREMI